MTTVLLTGFEPFAGDRWNPSGEAVGLVAARWGGPAELVTAVLPVTFAGAAASLVQLLDEHDPDVVIAVGLAGGRAAIGIERVAVNLVDARIPDNDGAQPVDEPSLRGAARAGFVHVPWGAGQAPAEEPELPVSDIVRALEIAVRTTLEVHSDVREAGGTLH